MVKARARGGAAREAPKDGAAEGLLRGAEGMGVAQLAGRSRRPRRRRRDPRAQTDRQITRERRRHTKNIRYMYMRMCNDDPLLGDQVIRENPAK